MRTRNVVAFHASVQYSNDPFNGSLSYLFSDHVWNYRTMESNYPFICLNVSAINMEINITAVNLNITKIIILKILMIMQQNLPGSYVLSQINSKMLPEI